MNYDKQKPLAQKEIDYINSVDAIDLINISNYPKGNIHVGILWDLPINITRNRDEFFINSNTINIENYWVVCPSYGAEQDFEFPVKQFKNIKKALKYGISEYKKWLKKRIMDMKEINLG